MTTVNRPVNLCTSSSRGSCMQEASKTHTNEDINKIAQEIREVYFYAVIISYPGQKFSREAILEVNHNLHKILNKIDSLNLSENALISPTYVAMEEMTKTLSAITATKEDESSSETPTTIPPEKPSLDIPEKLEDPQNVQKSTGVRKIRANPWWSQIPVKLKDLQTRLAELESLSQEKQQEIDHRLVIDLVQVSFSIVNTTYLTPIVFHNKQKKYITEVRKLRKKAEKLSPLAKDSFKLCRAMIIAKLTKETVPFKIDLLNRRFNILT